MAPRADRASAIYCELSQDEREVLDRMKAMGAVNTDANLMRIALWSLADHFDLEMPDGVFDCRHGSGKWQRVRRHDTNPHISQREPWTSPEPGETLPFDEPEGT